MTVRTNAGILEFENGWKLKLRRERLPEAMGSNWE
jgi:hypothetical protein